MHILSFYNKLLFIFIIFLLFYRNILLILDITKKYSITLNYSIYNLFNLVVTKLDRPARNTKEGIEIIIFLA
jgi:hypothetical protein